MNRMGTSCSVPVHPAGTRAETGVSIVFFAGLRVHAGDDCDDCDDCNDAGSCQRRFPLPAVSTPISRAVGTPCLEWRMRISRLEALWLMYNVLPSPLDSILLRIASRPTARQSLWTPLKT
ncbi:hypothetical protein M433DRAFT_393157 [Acidomyces richmondensis BFW]|nr:hypothetical protein M433DRAFT_393157 [Acidomyces richmondensis BFW]